MYFFFGIRHRVSGSGANRVRSSRLRLGGAPLGGFGRWLIGRCFGSQASAVRFTDSVLVSFV